MIEGLIVGIIGFFFGLFLMDFFNKYYLKMILVLVQHNPGCLDNPEIREAIGRILDG